MQFQFTELHVLVHALRGGSALSRGVLSQACRLQAAIFTEQQRTGACLPVPAPPDAPAAHGDTQPADAPMPTSESDYDDSSAAPAASASALFANGGAPTPVASAARTSARKVLSGGRGVSHSGASAPLVAARDASAPQNDAAAAPAAPDSAGSGDAKADDSQCQRPFSLFSVRPAIEAAG